MVDRVHALKIEAPTDGGTQTDAYPTPVNPNQDYLDAAGVTLQNAAGSSDTAVRLERDAAGNLQLTDVATSAALSALLKIADHGGLRDVAHFLAGPANGFGTGAYLEIYPVGSAVPTRATWWTSSSKTAKIFEVLLTRSGLLVTQAAYSLYASDGASVLHTVTDAISYFGVFPSTVTRTIT